MGREDSCRAHAPKIFRVVLQGGRHVPLIGGRIPIGDLGNGVGKPRIRRDLNVEMGGSVAAVVEIFPLQHGRDHLIDRPIRGSKTDRLR